jgi:hypothetical protein
MVIRTLFVFQRNPAKRQGIPTRQAKNATVVFVHRSMAALHPLLGFERIFAQVYGRGK